MYELRNTSADKNYKPSGISRAEERALEAYPEHWKFNKNATGTYDRNFQRRKSFIDGYEAAEKDLALTWEDIKTIVQILADSDWYDFEINGKLWSEDFYKEVLKRYEQKRNHQ